MFFFFVSSLTRGNFLVKTITDYDSVNFVFVELLTSRLILDTLGRILRSFFFVLQEMKMPNLSKNFRAKSIFGASKY